MPTMADFIRDESQCHGGQRMDRRGHTFSAVSNRGFGL